MYTICVRVYCVGLLVWANRLLSSVFHWRRRKNTKIFGIHCKAHLFESMCINDNSFIGFSSMTLKYRIFCVNSFEIKWWKKLFKQFFGDYLFVIPFFFLCVCCVWIISIYFHYFSKLEIMIVTQFCYVYTYINSDFVSFFQFIIAKKKEKPIADSILI